MKQKQIKVISASDPAVSNPNKQLGIVKTESGMVDIEPVDDEQMEYDPVDIDAMRDDYEITTRSDDIQQATMDYLSLLVGLTNDDNLDDYFGSSDEFEMLIDRIEEVLWDEFGLVIYRPRIVQDGSGIEHFVTNLADAEGMMSE